MAKLLFSNNAYTTISGAITATALSVAVSAGSGVEFPNPTSGQYFVATFNDAATGLLSEIIWVTARSGDTLTIVRAQEGTTALAWNAGDLLSNLWTAGSANQMLQIGVDPPDNFGQAALSGSSTTSSNTYNLTWNLIQTEHVQGNPQGLVQFTSANTSSTIILSDGSVSQPLVKLGGGLPSVGEVTGYLPVFDDGTNWRFTIPLPSDTIANVPSQLDGCCRLIFISTTQISLVQQGGQYLVINGVPQIIPSGGVTKSNASLLANVSGNVIQSPGFYYVYAYMSGTTMALNITTSAPTNNVLGQRVNSTDYTQRLVGAVITNSSAQFVDQSQFRGVSSFFNQIPLLLAGTSATASTSSSTFSEVGTSARVIFFCWTRGTVQVTAQGNGNGQAGIAFSMQVTIDGTAAGGSPSNYSSSTGQNAPLNANGGGNPTEGSHFISLNIGSVTAGDTANFTIYVASGQVQG